MVEPARTIRERWGLQHRNGRVAACSKEYALETHRKFPPLRVVHTVNGYWEEYKGD